MIDLSPRHAMAVAALAALLSACGERVPQAGADAVAAAPATAGAFNRIEPLALPVGGAASQPDLVATPDGGWLLAWVEPAAGDAHRLRFSTARDGGWSPAGTIAEGDDWFLNWADTPHVQRLPDGSLWAHWLRNTGPSRMDYGIDLVRSDDGGRSWSAPTLVNLADSLGDHGFVSLWSAGAGSLGIAWLDSRQKAAAGATGHDDDHHGGGPPMMLRAATFSDRDVPARLDEWPLDASTCDCCTTAAAVTDRGPVVVYRGRTAEEVRDIRLVRFEEGVWTAPHDVHADGWMMPGCPVNGPSVAVDGNTVWVAWFTQSDGPPEIRLARSDDAGDHFGAPVTVAKGGEVLGRVALARAGDGLLLAWLEEGAAQTLKLSRFDRDLRASTPLDVATLAIRGRASGLPRLAVQGDEARVVWTDVVDGQPVLRGAVVR